MGDQALSPRAWWRWLGHGAHGGQGTVGHTLQNLAAPNDCAVVLGKQTAQVPAWEQNRDCFKKGSRVVGSRAVGVDKWSQNTEKKKKENKDTGEKKNEKITCLERKAQESISSYDRKVSKGSKRPEVRQNKHNIEKLQMKDMTWCKPAVTVTQFQQWRQQLWVWYMHTLIMQSRNCMHLGSLYRDTKATDWRRKQVLARAVWKETSKHCHSKPV